MEENIDKLEGNIPSQDLIISEEIKFFLKETAKWGKFLSVVGFVFCGIIAIVAIGMMFFGSKMLSAMSGGMGAVGGGFIGAIYLVMGLLYYFPSKYLFDFSVFIKQAFEINDQESLTYAFSRLKSLYRFWGVLVAVMLGFYAVILVVSIVSMVFIAR